MFSKSQTWWSGQKNPSSFGAGRGDDSGMSANTVPQSSVRFLEGSPTYKGSPGPVQHSFRGDKPDFIRRSRESTMVDVSWVRFVLTGSVTQRFLLISVLHTVILVKISTDAH